MSDYAIVETGAKQYWVEPNSVLDVEVLDLQEGQKEVELANVLLVRKGENVLIGSPVLSGAKVLCDYLGQIRGKKVVSFKFRRRKNSRRKIGHRQNLSRLLVKEIKV